MRGTLLSAILFASLLQPTGANAQQVIGADLSVTARANPDAASAGDEVTLIVNAANSGPEQANEVTLTVGIPQGLVALVALESPAPCSIDGDVVCRIGPMAPGASMQLRFLVGVTGAGSHAAPATVTGRQDDPAPENNQATAELSAKGKDCARVGTIEPDLLRAGRGGSVVCAFSGDDTLLGGPRRDTLLGGSGRDALVGGAGRDTIDGGRDVDACAGDPAPGTESGCENDVFALAGTLPLVDPGTATVRYGYHQSLFGTAIELRPFGEHVVMSSRNRGTGSTTAADVVTGSGATVRTPVTGEIVAVKRYLLYCERPDWKIVIRPDADPSLRVLVFHLGRPGVEDGDAVIAGVSRLGRARQTDWPDSQKNRYFGARDPHFQVEVERDRASPTPGCAI